MVADDSRGRTRYRLLETVRHTRWKSSAIRRGRPVRARHRDYYTAMAAVLDAPARPDYEGRLEQADREIDNLRAAFGWSRENSDTELALALASSLQPLWQARGRLREGRTWFDAALADVDAHHPEVAAAVRARALADRAMLAIWAGAPDSPDQAQQALANARELDDPALLARALTACGYITAYSAESAGAYFAEAIGLARALDDRWRLRQILGLQTGGAHLVGDPIGIRATGEEGRDLADAIGDRYHSRLCRCCLGWAKVWQGDLAGGAAQFGEVAASPRQRTMRSGGWAASRTRATHSHTRVRRVRPAPQPTRPPRPPPSLARLRGRGLHEVGCRGPGRGRCRDCAGGVRGGPAAPEFPAPDGGAGARPGAQAALAGGDLIAARRWADDAVATTGGWYSFGADDARPSGDRAR